MKRRFASFFFTVFVLTAFQGRSQTAEPLTLLQTIPLPGLHDGGIDHFGADLQGHRLFLAAEENSLIEVFDLRSNKLIHTLTDVKAPHSLLYRADLKKLFVVDGDAAEVKIYDGSSYKLIGGIKLEEDCDSMTYDPATKYMYVVNGGKGAHSPYSLISVIDTTYSKRLSDIKIDTDSVEALAVEKAGTRLFANLTGLNAVGVIDREKHTVLATWSVAQEAEHPVALALDEANHRLFTATRQPGKLIVLDTDSGKVVTSLPCVGMVDDMAFDPGNKRIYISGTEFVDVFQQNDADHYEPIGHIPTSFRAKTAILLPQLKRYYLAVPHHGDKTAEVRVYEVRP